MTHLLDNIAWNALTGRHRHFAIGNDEARRYETGFPAFVAFADQVSPNFDAIAPFCPAGEHFYCDGWAGAPPQGWQVDFDGRMFKMIWDAPMPAALDDDGDDCRALGGSDDRSRDSVGTGYLRTIPLTHADAGQALELTRITKPGPFGPRNLDLGEYFGMFDGERLVAMAGERLAAGAFREVSAVCTHPDYQGRGLARQLMTKIIRRQMQRGEVPFLHVMCSNETARGLYERMGFAVHREAVVRVVSRT